MSAWGEVLVGLVIAVGLAGVVVQVLPGSVIVLGAVLVWAVVTGGTTAWVCFAVGAAAVVVAAVVKYLLAGRHLLRHEISSSTLVWGGVAGVVGFFVIPVVGLLVGFVAGVWLAELVRRRAAGPAWRATVVALQATGISILVELAGALVATGAWVVGLVLT
ncbi:hypothetical protein CLV28_0379 [Sediminihabitans luteus]|uniref:DUF456 domain-containing protein n=1 Tax=Sediminihabitans luteus TaxID=1138585 RepID=A0A2M9CZA6_9CELL|nr:DUF456 domain-containing protein [Sediminihabitans luteus]PJJ77165.1 hypothetical protein CLV28_0379 [Sediminihabitans luteus]GII98613.1 membrane protein [Sediminihabitans luteus]